MHSEPSNVRATPARTATLDQGPQPPRDAWTRPGRFLIDVAGWSRADVAALDRLLERASAHGCRSLADVLARSIEAARAASP